MTLEEVLIQNPRRQGAVTLAMPASIIKLSAFRHKKASFPSHLNTKKDNIRFFPSGLQLSCVKESCIKEISFDSQSQDLQAQASRCIALIDDPLWRHVCTEVLPLMGPLSVLQIWKSKIGIFSPQHKAIDIDCQTEKKALFLQQYDFVILGILKKYFSSLKSIRIKGPDGIQVKDFYTQNVAIL